MLEKNYNNLYEMKLYKKEAAITKNNQLDNDVERDFAFANLLYVLSKECIGLSSNDPLRAQIIVTNDLHPIISNILIEEPQSIDVLYDLQGPNESKKMTMLDASILVCERHIENLRTR